MARDPELNPCNDTAVYNEFFLYLAVCHPAENRKTFPIPIQIVWWLFRPLFRPKLSLLPLWETPMGDLSYRDTPYRPIVATRSVLGNVGAVVALVLASTWRLHVVPPRFGLHHVVPRRGSNNNDYHYATSSTKFSIPRSFYNFLINFRTFRILISKILIQYLPRY